MSANTDIRNQAFLDWQKGLKYKEIADKYGINLSTIKLWAARYWKKEGCNQKTKKLQPKNEKNSTSNANQKVVNNENIQLMDNPDLTDKQRLFCILYIRCFNATKAYQKAYDCDYRTAQSNGCKLLTNTYIREEIKNLKQNRLNREMLDEHDIFQKYMDIAFSDLTDFVIFGCEEVPVIGKMGLVIDKKTGKPIMRENNYVKFKDSAQVDGSLLNEVKQGKNGASIKLADRMKALQWIADHMDLATEEQKLRIEKLKKSMNVHTSDNEIEVQIYLPDNGRGDK